MAANPDNACLSRPVPAATDAEPHSIEPALVDQASASDYPQDLLQNYTQLSERYRRTTNALASAAHDLRRRRARDRPNGSRAVRYGFPPGEHRE